MAYLKIDNIFTEVFSKYAQFEDIFSLKLTVKLPDHMGINNHALKLVNDWQPSYSPIYSLDLIELEILKAYIENNLNNSFIKPFKFLARALIFFDQKPNRTL